MTDKIASIIGRTTGLSYCTRNARCILCFNYECWLILPYSWTVHRCNGENEGLLYFMDESGQTSWQIHPEVDKLCSDRKYLEYGRLNVENFDEVEQ